MNTQEFNKPSAHIYSITTSECPDTGRVTAVSEDIPGLVIEADNIADVMKFAQNLIPDLLECNDVDEKRDSIPVRIDDQETFHVSRELGG